MRTNARRAMVDPLRQESSSHVDRNRGRGVCKGMTRKTLGRVLLWGPFAILAAGMAWRAPGLFLLLVVLAAFAASITAGAVLTGGDE